MFWGSVDGYICNAMKKKLNIVQPLARKRETYIIRRIQIGLYVIMRSNLAYELFDNTVFSIAAMSSFICQQET